MKTVVMVLAYGILLVIGFVVSSKGLNLRKWSSWLYGAISFFCGLAIGFSLNGNLLESTKMGGIFAVVILFTGMTMRWHKQRYEGSAKSLFLQYGKEDDPSLFATLVRKLLSKYKG